MMDRHPNTGRSKLTGNERWRAGKFLTSQSWSREKEEVRG